MVRIEIADRYEIFGQFFTWEVATAVAGSVMGINPFDQPDVESAKIETRAITTEYEKTRKLPVRKPVYAGEGALVFASDEYAARLKAGGAGASLGPGYARISVRSRPAIISPSWLPAHVLPSTRRPSRSSGTAYAT